MLFCLQFPNPLSLIQLFCFRYFQMPPLKARVEIRLHEPFWILGSSIWCLMITSIASFRAYVMPLTICGQLVARLSVGSIWKVVVLFAVLMRHHMWTSYLFGLYCKNEIYDSRVAVIVRNCLDLNNAIQLLTVTILLRSRISMLPFIY